MKNKLDKQKHLYQETIVCEIESQFGNEFVYFNDSGNVAIGKMVLREFRKLTELNVIWERGNRCWRYREAYDKSSARMQE